MTEKPFGLRHLELGIEFAIHPRGYRERCLSSTRQHIAVPASRVVQTRGTS